MTLTPLQLVASICAVIGLNVGLFYLMEALPKWLQGPRRTLAVWGVMAVFVVCVAVNGFVMLRAGHQALNFAFLGLLPALEVTRVAPRASPRRLQLALLAFGAAGLVAGLSILLRSMQSGAQDQWTWGLFAVFALGSAGNLAWSLWKIQRKETAA